AFLRRLAATYGCVLYVTAGDIGDTFHFISQNAAMSKAPQVTVYYGRSGVDHRLLTFEASVDAAQIELPRALSGFDPDLGKATEPDQTQVLDVGTTDDPDFDEKLSALTAVYPGKAAALAALITSASTSRAAVRTLLATSKRSAKPSLTSEAQQIAISL